MNYHVDYESLHICVLRLFHWNLLTVEEVCSHQELESNLWRNGELWDLGGAVGESDLVGEVHTNFLENMRGDLSEVHLICLIF